MFEKTDLHLRTRNRSHNRLEKIPEYSIEQASDEATEIIQKFGVENSSHSSDCSGISKKEIR